VLSIGGKVVTRDTSPEDKMEIMYSGGRSSPMRSWQTLLDLAREMGRDEASRRKFVDFEMLALTFCLDAAARAKVDAFLTALPAEARADFRSAERLVAPVFDRWLWQGDHVASWGRGEYVNTSYVPGDASRASMSFTVEYSSGRKQVGQFSFKRFDDGWRYGPLGEADAEQMLALLDPRTGRPKSSQETAR
jgi:hypothetical protein